ncbi:MAG: energy-coupling factor transporter transmembrane protein EcfT [Synergistaceae bacterium]|jgi:energy-coupling factor transport system permease protein|nr:energy-coupling factor transporter transmembrane protein EcfT [Synergistaceae bacterium]
MKFSNGFSMGQFVPGESRVHSLDPRCKIMGMFILLAVPFAAKKPLDFVPAAFCLYAISAASGIRFAKLLRAGRPVLFLIAFTAILNLFWTPGREITRLGPLRVTAEGVTLAFCVSLRIYCLVMMAAALMMTTSPMDFASGAERLMSPLAVIKFPVSEMAMMMTIALRFIPTLFEESERIMKAQMSRGADFESGGLIKRARAYIPILAPLFIQVFVRADNLATAMESRCYVPGAPRTKLNPLVWRSRDTAAMACVIAFVVFSLVWNRYIYRLADLLCPESLF